MNDHISQQILKELQFMKTEMQSVKTEMQSMKTEMQSMNNEIQSVKNEQQTTNNRLGKIEVQVSDIALIKQAVLETLELTQRLELTQSSYESTTMSELNTHRSGIELLSKEQFKIKVELELLKQR